MPAIAVNRPARALAAPERTPRAVVQGWGWPVGCAAGFLGLSLLLRRFVTDDAWITVRYAENLSAGWSFAWNPGGPAVEGFSNPLLVGMEALGTEVGLRAIDVGRALGIVSGVVLIALI